MSHTAFPALFEKLSPDERICLYEWLSLACERLLRKHGRKARHYQFDGQDLANETLMRAWSEQRRYPAGLPLRVFLANIAKSILSHESERLEHQKQRLAVDDGDPKSIVHTLAANDNPEATAIANVALGEFKAGLQEELQDYIEDLIEFEGSSAKELEEKTGKRVLNLNRKLSRRRSQYGGLE